MNIYSDCFSEDDPVLYLGVPNSNLSHVTNYTDQHFPYCDCSLR